MLVALASVVVDHIQQHLQTGRVQGPYVTWNSAISPPGRPARAAAGWRLRAARCPASGRSARHPH